MATIYTMIVRKCTVDENEVNADTVFKVEVTTQYLFVTKSKKAALNDYNTYIHDNFCNSNTGSFTPKAEIYLYGFDAESDIGVKLSSVGRELDKLSQENLTEYQKEEYQSNIKAILSPEECLFKKDQAVQSFNYVTDGVEAVSEDSCAWCGAKVRNLLRGNNIVHNFTLCDTCWESYLSTSRGMVEYAFAIICGKHSTNDFSDAELTAIKTSWKLNRPALLYYLRQSLIEANPELADKVDEEAIPTRIVEALESALGLYGLTIDI